MLSVSRENFLKSIYKWVEAGESKVLPVVLAKDMGLSKAAVSQMVKRMEEEGLVVYSRERGIELSEKGHQLALQVVRRHRLWELFLVEVLGYGWEEVHVEAERLEHHSSDELMNRIDAHLGHPSFDPHGYPIPDVRGRMPHAPAVIRLAEAEVGKSYTVARIQDENADLVFFLGKRDIAPGETIVLLEGEPFEGLLKVKTKKGIYRLGAEAVEAVSLYVL